MKTAYRGRWLAEVTELQGILSELDLNEECKWGSPATPWVDVTL